MHTNTSEQFFERSKKVIPWGSSTCSKAAYLQPYEPVAIVKGKGCRVWDIEGREFIDFRNGLGPITLGYQFPEVDEAIRTQLESGILFGHPSILECEVAEMLTEVIPCAEQVRFLKTGGEAMAACIRIARGYTDRDHIVQVGYNGWLNSLSAGGPVLPRQSGGSFPSGIPGCLSELHHSCGWNDIDAIKKVFEDVKGNLAAIVIAADYKQMEKGSTYYREVRDFADKNGVLLIFDEIVTGFRIAMGGAQEYFNVTPDMAVFSKGIANGMPISVYAGRREVMQKCDKGNGIVISSTFAGEALSLAVAKAVINVYKSCNVVEHLWKQGEKMWTSLNKIFEDYNIPVEIKGFWPCPTFTSKADAPADIISKFMYFAYKHGVSLYNVSYVNFSHKDNDINEALQRLENACKELSVN
ncbi:MAG TPA: aminotransferase class III-fold pyridoxal phosphate-dependent enzyme [Clostridiales bacterium]|nr:aminotransferase class III-fold pyridoxal phosphate-dependent enzyme [Clostridiales bacterium]